MNPNIKAKLSQYSQSVSVAYVQSLAKLTHQVAIVDAKVNMDDLVKWHDQSFFQQISKQDKRNSFDIDLVVTHNNDHNQYNSRKQ
jgi:hypothetical protein